MEVVKWWVQTHELDHFEKEVNIKELIISNL
jgi:hypothetical protein